MKLPPVLLPTCLALILSACSSPSSPAPGGTNTGNNIGNNGGTPGGTTTSTYYFLADYTVLDSLTVGQGSIYPYKDNFVTTATLQSLAETAVPLFIPINNNLPLKSAGESVALSVTLDGTVFTGSATVPNALVGVTLTQGATPVTPASGTITIDPALALVVSWSLSGLANPPAFVTVVNPNDSTKTRKVSFSGGTITLPAGWAASGSTFTVYATNEATNLAPTAHLDAAHAYFRVNHAVNDASDRFVVAHLPT